MINLLSLPTRTGDAQKDLDTLWAFVEDLVNDLTGLADRSDILNDGLGGEKVVGEYVVLPPISFGAPPTPTGLTAIALWDAIAICWDLVCDPTITGYEIQRADDKFFTVNVHTLAMVTGFQYVDSNLGGAGVRYYYRIRAHRRGEATPSSWTADVDTTTVADTSQLTQIEALGTALQAARLL